MLSCLLGLVIAVAGLAAEGGQTAATGAAVRTDLVSNGTFATGIEPWSAVKMEDGKPVKAPEMLALDTKDVPTPGAVALRIAIHPEPKATWPSHVYGVTCPLREHLSPNREVVVSFSARSVTGARILSVGRAGGGGNATVTLDDQWRAYTVPLRPSFQGSALLWNLVPKAVPGIQPVQDGEFLLSGVSVMTNLTQPTIADFSYGPHPRQTLDFWRAPGTTAAPLLVYIHGGGWLHGSEIKRGPGVRATVDGWHDRGISVAYIYYRYSTDAPLPAPVHDAARAIQTLRSKAKAWGFDPTRVAVTGDSAGGCTSLWLATHDDLADPASADPVARESSRVCGAAVFSAQSTIDPVVIRKDVYETAVAHAMICRSAGFATNAAMDAGYDKAKSLYYEFSPINHLSKDDPPVWMSYTGPVTDPAEGIHSARFGVIFKKRADEVGAPCWLNINRNPELYPKAPGFEQFIVDVLRPQAAK
jgi:acetyl esterase/lipase